MRKLVAEKEISLAALLAGSGFTKTKVKQLLKHRAISVGNVPVTRHDQTLRPGDEVCLKTEKEMGDAGKVCRGLTIIYEDESIIVIDKSAGLLTIATEKEKTRTAYYYLNALLKERPGPAGQRIFIVHRLDRETSGLLVFARNEAAKRTLQERWPDTDKRYAAIVEGIPKETSGRIASNLRETKFLRVYSVRDREGGGRPSVTSYQLVQSSGNYALLDITLETGRKNQIRVHLADIGHPVAGDKKYGARTNPVGRLALHAYYLAFAHPVTGKRLEFRVTLPGRLRAMFPETAV